MKILFALCSLLLLFSCRTNNSSDSHLIFISGSTMGTTYSVKIVPDKNYTGQDYYKFKIDSLLKVVNNQMSTYIEDSEISRFNNFDDTVWFPISSDFAEVLAEALRIGKLSGGALDITVGALVNLWGFGPNAVPERIPDENTLRKARSFCGLDKIELDVNKPAVKKKNTEIYIDLSSIAKGFGVDKVSSLLDDLGIEAFMVEIGGEVTTKGTKPDKSPWRIGISTPDSEAGIEKIVNLTGTSMATSGDYKNFFVKNNRRYSHTIDPKTGRPITHNLASVSVIHSSCMTADGFATAFDVLGAAKGVELADRLELPVFFIVRDSTGFRELYSEKFKDYLN